MKKSIGWLDVVAYYCYLLLIWGVFRLTVRLPLVWEEAVFKPLIWGLPLISIWFAEKKRPKLFEGNVIQALGWGGLVGLLYVGVMLASGRMENGFSPGLGDGWWMDVIGIGLVTAIVEEMVFAGYILSKISGLFSFWISGGITAVLFALINMPIGVFVYQYSDLQLVGFLGLVGVVALGHYWVMNRTKNVIAPILSHWIWIVAVGLWG